MFLREMLRPVVIGVVIGVVVAVGASRVLEARLFGISPFDPIAFAGAAALLAVAAAAATVVPTRKAAALDPMGVLRHQ